MRLDSSRVHDDGDPVLFQEELIDQHYDPLSWGLGVGSIVLQRTGRSQAFPVIQRLLTEWSPLRCLDHQFRSFRQLVECLKPSGLPEAKALRIQRISHDYSTGLPPDNWVSLSGYTKDSVMIFFTEKYLTWYVDRLPDDGHLKNYVLKWRGLHETHTIGSQNGSTSDYDSGRPASSSIHHTPDHLGPGQDR